ncbi:uncharacterized protein LOC110463096 [Mizuhopecten yessoensis]|uniref:Uncharacterized protein n=1 Tax=Mizuhopecten yessoensis TaxID=6573 RepID=A0A210PWV9_MIZYE|nr:uncharacterized protein LOC110463096 [Mizuhopecten yessoensis]OWF40959.1 hypothetical protein KP79_PYT15986 [Mizuhopecten yessoensis]
MSEKKLRMITYLSPGLPVELFETIMQYLEEVTEKEAYLIYESRWAGPPRDRTDPFTADEVDIGFMRSETFLPLQQRKNSHVELCGAAPLHVHPSSQSNPVYFSDLIINTSDIAEFKEVHNLQGRSFAYEEEDSLSGCLVVLQGLKKMGYNSTFFGNVLKSGSHLKSIQMVLNKTAASAAVDSTVLYNYLQQNPKYKENITILKSFGPLPIYPVVFNSRLPDDLKGKISQALLDMTNKKDWLTRLEAFGVEGFKQVDMSSYLKEKELLDAVKKLSVTAAYY